jgi:hypothetical protein
MRRMALRKAAIGGAVICAVLAVQLFLYSPWHRDPAQGRQYCRFFTVEHGSALEACGSVVIAPPVVEQGRLHEEPPRADVRCYPKQRACRAPPA